MTRCHALLVLLRALESKKLRRAAIDNHVFEVLTMVRWHVLVVLVRHVACAHVWYRCWTTLRARIARRCLSARFVT